METHIQASPNPVHDTLAFSSPTFLTFFAIKLLESHLHIHFDFLDPIYSSVLSSLTFIFTSPLKLLSHQRTPYLCSQLEHFHLHLTSWVMVTFSTWLLCNKPRFSLSLGFSEDTDTHTNTHTYRHTHTLCLYTRVFRAQADSFSSTLHFSSSISFSPWYHSM